MSMHTYSYIASYNYSAHAVIIIIIVLNMHKILQFFSCETAHTAASVVVRLNHFGG